MISDGAIQKLRSAIRGPVIAPGDAAYDGVRRIFNAMIDRRPAAIVRCAGAGDVIAAVTFAREHDVAVSVRGGGHSVAGSAILEGGLMIDLEEMKGIRVDPSRLTARAQPGVRLGELDRETQAFGLATPLGVATDTGIAGLTLGGGIGWLNGKHGLSCDNVLSFDVVTADGALRTANANQHEDLYWALRGGSGNFGVVTSFEYQLHRVGPAVLGGMIAYPFTRAKAVLGAFLEFSEGCPDELSTVAGLLTLPDGTPAVAVAVCFCGGIDTGARLVAPLRSLGTPLVDGIQPLPYVAQQALMDDVFPPKVNHHYWKSSFATAIGEAGLEMFIEQMARKPSPLTFAYLQQLHGAAARVPVDATAFSHRGYRYDFAILTQWSDPADTDRNVRWTRDAFAAMEPHLDTGVYVNNLGEEGTDRVRAAFGANYDRLVEVKSAYDPDNVFQSTQNIRPAPRMAV